jgi:hypothetical protein
MNVKALKGKDVPDLQVKSSESSMSQLRNTELVAGPTTDPTEVQYHVFVR